MYFAMHKLRNFSSPSTVKPHLSPPPGASTASWPRPLDLVEWSVPYGSEVESGCGETPGEFRWGTNGKVKAMRVVDLLFGVVVGC